jgi:pyridoxine 4-dehydrogenase
VARSSAPAASSSATRSETALAWPLTRSPQVLPIPGSSNPGNVEENAASASIEFTAKEIRVITLAVRPPAG